MRCIVTCGPTYEPLDQVRRLTNFSTGTLGIQLANYLTAQGCDVFLLKGYYCTTARAPVTPKVEVFTTTDDLASRLQKHSREPFAAVFHAAAVSDFGFGQVYCREMNGALSPIKAGKFATNGQPLLVELEPTIKILPQLRGWFGSALIAGWKYEVDGNQESALAKGLAQLETCRTDLCIVNGPACGDGFSVLTKNGSQMHCQNHSVLVERLHTLLMEPGRNNRG